MESDGRTLFFCCSQKHLFVWDKSYQQHVRLRQLRSTPSCTAFQSKLSWPLMLLISSFLFSPKFSAVIFPPSMHATSGFVLLHSSLTTRHSCSRGEESLISTSTRVSMYMDACLACERILVLGSIPPIHQQRLLLNAASWEGAGGPSG